MRTLRTHIPVKLCVVRLTVLLGYVTVLTDNIEIKRHMA